MAFGTKKSEQTDEYDGEILKYLRNFRDGDNVVRFIEEVDDWLAFKEHYNSQKQSYPCSGDKNSCPGCNAETDDERKASRKYGTNLYLPKIKLVLPYRIPMTLAKKMFTRAERNGTITNRDWIVIRAGKGFDTEYDVEQDEKYPLNLDEIAKDALDIEDVLQTMYGEVWGTADDVEPALPAEDADVTEDDIRAMSKAALIRLAKREDIKLPPFDMDNKEALANFIIEELS